MYFILQMLRTSLSVKNISCYLLNVCDKKSLRLPERSFGTSGDLFPIPMLYTADIGSMSLQGGLPVNISMTVQPTLLFVEKQT